MGVEVSFFPHIYYIRLFQKTSSRIKEGKISEFSVLICLLLRNQAFSRQGYSVEWMGRDLWAYGRGVV